MHPSMKIDVVKGLKMRGLQPRIASQNTRLYKNHKFLDEEGDFSFANWIDNYRTCDDEGNRLYFNAEMGNTRIGGDFGYLQNGELTRYKIGKKVTNTLSFDVYKPTHIFLFHGSNQSITKTEYDDFINKVKESFPNAVIGLGTPHVAGTIFPSFYPNYANV